MTQQISTAQSAKSAALPARVPGKSARATISARPPFRYWTCEKCGLMRCWRGSVAALSLDDALEQIRAGAVVQDDLFQGYDQPAGIARLADLAQATQPRHAYRLPACRCPCKMRIFSWAVGAVSSSIVLSSS